MHKALYGWDIRKKDKAPEEATESDTFMAIVEANRKENRKRSLGGMETGFEVHANMFGGMPTGLSVTLSDSGY